MEKIKVVAKSLHTPELLLKFGRDYGFKINDDNLKKSKKNIVLFGILNRKRRPCILTMDRIKGMNSNPKANITILVGNIYPKLGQELKSNDEPLLELDELEESKESKESTSIEIDGFTSRVDNSWSSFKIEGNLLVLHSTNQSFSEGVNLDNPTSIKNALNNLESMKQGILHAKKLNH